MCIVNLKLKLKWLLYTEDKTKLKLVSTHQKTARPAIHASQRCVDGRTLLITC